MFMIISYNAPMWLIFINTFTDHFHSSMAYMLKNINNYFQKKQNFFLFQAYPSIRPTNRTSFQTERSDHIASLFLRNYCSGQTLSTAQDPAAAGCRTGLLSFLYLHDPLRQIPVTGTARKDRQPAETVGTGMKQIPEPSLLPPEYPTAALRCCLCHHPVPEALELLYGPICRSCLQSVTEHHSMDQLSALLCAAVLTNDIPEKEASL